MKRRFALLSGLFWECVIELDFDHPDFKAGLVPAVEFWTDFQDYLDDADVEGVYHLAFLKRLGEKIAFLATGNTKDEIIREFQDEEGWLNLDGSCGVLLVSCEDFLFTDITIEEITDVPDYGITIEREEKA